MDFDFRWLILGLCVMVVTVGFNTFKEYNKCECK